MRYLLAAIICLSACGDGLNEIGSTGDACEVNDDCTGGTCGLHFGDDLETEELEGDDFPGGYCTNECDAYWQCEWDELCLGYNPLVDPTRTCYKMCTEDEDCRVNEGYLCVQLSPFNAEAKVCLPDFLDRSWS